MKPASAARRTPPPASTATAPTARAQQHELLDLVRQPYWIVGLGAGVVAMLALLAVIHFSGERDRARERQLERNALYARVLEDQITRSLDAAALVMDAIAAQSPGIGGRADLPAPSDLARLIAPQALIRSVAVLDGRGLVLASSRDAEVGLTVPLVQLGYRSNVRTDVIGTQVPARSLDEWLRQTPDTRTLSGVDALPLMRTLPPAQGGAIVLLMLNSLAIETTMRLVTEEPGVTATLAKFDGSVIVSSGRRQSHRIPTVDSPVFRALQAGKDHDTLLGVGSGAEGVHGIAYRASPSRPLLTIVERPLATIDSDWWEESMNRIVLALAALLAVAAFTTVSVLNARQRNAAQVHLIHQLRLTEQLFDLSPLPISILDESARYTQVNKAWETFMGRTRDEILGTSAHLGQSATNAARHNAIDRELLDGGPPVQYHDRQLRGDGRQRDLVINKVAVPGPDGRPQGVLVIFADVTEIQDAERATREARDAAQEAARAKDEFIANMSHELRTPLQSIIGFSELGMLRSRSDNRMLGMFSDIHTSGRRMLALVNDLLDVSKIESSVGTIHLESTDLRPLLREVVQELEPLFLAKRLTANIGIDEHRVLARVDPTRFQQVVRNIVANAVKFSPPDAAIDVDLRCDLTGGAVLRVRDHGPGIPQGELAAIFEAFVQSSRTKDGSGGTGLGLSISHKIVDAHGGTVRAENANGGGACFIVTLPPCSPAATEFGSFTTS